MIMTHSDDDGLILPPKLAPAHVVIIPVVHKPEDAAAISAYTQELAAMLRGQSFDGRPVQVELDARDMRGGDKAWQWIKRGVPVRVEVGPRDMAQDSVFMARRDRAHKEKVSLKRGEFVAGITALLQEIQDGLLNRAAAFAAEHTRDIDTRKEFEEFFAAPATAENQPTPIHGGFARAHFCGDPKVEIEMKDRLGVTVRCIPLTTTDAPGSCVITGQPSTQRVIWAKAY